MGLCAGGRLRCGAHTPKRLSEAVSVPQMGFLILLDEHRRPHSHIIEGIGAYDTILPPTGIYPMYANRVGWSWTPVLV